MAPFDSAALVYRQPNLAKAVHTQDASYLDPLRTADAWNPSDYAYHLTRRARGLPFLVLPRRERYAAPTATRSSTRSPSRSTRRGSSTRTRCST